MLCQSWSPPPVVRGPIHLKSACLEYADQSGRVSEEAEIFERIAVDHRQIGEPSATMARLRSLRRTFVEL
jgi:hypothetical protein